MCFTTTQDVYFFICHYHFMPIGTFFAHSLKLQVLQNYQDTQHPSPTPYLWSGRVEVVNLSVIQMTVPAILISIYLNEGQNI